MMALAMALMFLVASNVTRVEAAPVNNLTQEQIEAIVRNMYDKFAAFDAQGTTNCFAPVGGQEAAIKWRIRLKTKTGNVFFLEGIGIVKVNGDGDGKIQSARNFFDLAYLQITESA